MINIDGQSVGGSLLEVFKSNGKKKLISIKICEVLEIWVPMNSFLQSHSSFSFKIASET